MFIFIVALTALFIAGCAAFFSIKGITLLFAGSAISVAVMASSLEIGKLVAASFLHREWAKISWVLKTYLLSAVAVLMLITSLGIFGFLTKAYQEHRGVVVGYETELQGANVQVSVLKEELAANQVRIDSLNTLRKDQEARVNAAGNYKGPREQAYKAITEANKELAGKETRQSELRKLVGELEIKKTQVTQDMNTKTDIGSFQFVAKALGTDVDTAVKYFILCLVFVFDPLAVTLVLALNHIIENRQKDRQREQKVQSTPTVEKISKEPLYEEEIKAFVEAELSVTDPVDGVQVDPVSSVPVTDRSSRRVLNSNDSITTSKQQ